MLRSAFIILTLGFAMKSQASQFDYLPSSKPEEKEFLSLMNNGNFKPALTAWNSAHGLTNFGSSANGKATLAYLMLQNGLTLSGLDLVLSVNPKNLSPAVLKIWKTELNQSAFIQKGWMQTSGSWKNVHNNSSATIKIKSVNDIKKALSSAAVLSKEGANSSARVLWQIATQAPQINQIDSSLKALKMLRESGQTVIGKDQVSSAYGRVLYQKGDLNAAMQAFQEIPKSSSLWVESVEERAWTSLKREDYDKALGETITLLSPALTPLVGPESYYLANLIALKTCDYPRIFKNSETFKKRHSARLSAMQDLAKTGTNKSINALFERMDQRGTSVEAAGSLVEWIPRSAFRDVKFIRFMETRRQWLAESKKAQDLLSSVEALGTSENLQRIPNEARHIADRLKQLAFQRVRFLAGEELKEYRQNLNRMHIIEGEVIQRLAVDETLKGQRSKLAKVEDQGDVLVFPYNSDEVWIDELDNYKARVKDCPTLKEASL
jgi:tetratricopeptide (TPR) repeat protein